jgi:hypothetical protein
MSVENFMSYVPSDNGVIKLVNHECKEQWWDSKSLYISARLTTYASERVPVANI